MQQIMTATNCEGLYFTGSTFNVTNGLCFTDNTTNNDTYTELGSSDIELGSNDNSTVSFLWRSEYGWPLSYVSDNIEQFGYSPEDFLSNGLSYEDIIHPGDVIRVRKALLEHSEHSQSTLVQEYRILTCDGRIRWVREETSFIFDEPGFMKYLKGMIRDITGIVQLNDLLFPGGISKMDLTYNNRPADVANKAIGFAKKIENIDVGAIYFLDELKGGLQLQSDFGLSDKFLSEISYYNPGSALVHFADQGLPAYKHYSDIYALISRKYLRSEGLQATAIIPIHYEERFIGLFIAASTGMNFFPEEVREQLGSISLLCGMLMSNFSFLNKNH